MGEGRSIENGATLLPKGLEEDRQEAEIGKAHLQDPEKTVAWEPAFLVLLPRNILNPPFDVPVSYDGPQGASLLHLTAFLCFLTVNLQLPVQFAVLLKVPNSTVGFIHGSDLMPSWPLLGAVMGRVSICLFLLFSAFLLGPGHWPLWTALARP